MLGCSKTSISPMLALDDVLERGDYDLQYAVLSSASVLIFITLDVDKG